MADLLNKEPDVSTPRHEMEDFYREVSSARQALRDSYQNLQNVADYCEKNYMEAPDKRKALESTMSLVTQTLASVACQVGVAARHVSDMLEVQSLMLQKEEARVRYVSQLLDIHVEKVARQKIGKLTTAKKFPHAHKIQSGQKKPLASYTRTLIDFTSLDNTGHGLLDSDLQLSKTGTMSRKISVKTMGQTMGRSCRSRDLVSPPIIPSQKYACPISPDVISSPSFLDFSGINGDSSLPPPEFPSSLALETRRSVEKGSSFPDSYTLPDIDLPPPPPEPDVNGSPCLPTPNIQDIQKPVGKHLESIDEYLPPPPPIVDDGDKHYTPSPVGHGLTSSVCAQPSDEDLPPPPAPDYEIAHPDRPVQSADVMMDPSSLDDLPPPPDL